MDGGTHLNWERVGFATALTIIVMLVAGGSAATCVALEHRAFGADCSLIKDPDERHMCRALTHHLRSECEFIKRADTRELCRVMLDEEKKRP